MSRNNVGSPWYGDDEEWLIGALILRRPLNYICDKLGRNERGIFERAKRLYTEGRLAGSHFDHAAKIYDIWMQQNEISDDLKSNGVRMSNNSTWTMVSLLQENIRTVKVKFCAGNDKTYTFKTRDKTIREGDVVVVNPGLKEERYDAAIVVKIDETPDINPDSGLRYHWIVGKVDLKPYEELVAQDQKAYELLVEAEKHVARKKMIDLYSEALQLSGNADLKQLLSGSIDDSID